MTRRAIRTLRANIFSASIFLTPFGILLASTITSQPDVPETVQATLLGWKTVHRPSRLMEIITHQQTVNEDSIRSKIRFTIGKKSYIATTDTPVSAQAQMVINTTGIAYIFNGDPSMVRKFLPR